MNTITQTIENNIISFCQSLASMNAEVTDISQYYFGSTASTLIGNVTDGTTGVTVSSSLDKTQFLSGITLCQALQNFFNNSAVTASNYLQTCDGLIHGHSAASAILSPDVEDIGSRIKAIAQNLIQLRKTGDDIVKSYNASQLSGIIGSLSPQTVVYGCNTTQGKFISGIVLVEQLIAFLTGQTVSQSDYATTISNWVYGS